ncbi:hypothetical protein EFK50_19420 [Nocardioides marmoriginsengisoli]|uniref:peptidylprolyl isomerase n=1 Tax=Nocardioides marmoriginsengisoli TaxID=661483 RepID=A0A3N0CAK7_9ACTN|nr:FKBP-type peptidyl-prolyl cis-trans isomerase [Nocardioides marmoriginsengisoli]RNL60495.1 hypothetical protein EFK50_19420 [Nocardioides marmoriginsengisoli]
MVRTPTSRRMVPIASLVVLALSVAGCGGDDKKDGPAATGDPVSNGCGYKSGAASDAVEVKGDFGKEVTATFSRPLKASSLQRSVVTKGDGATPPKNAVLNVSLSMFSGKDGKSVVAGTQKFTVGDAEISKSLQASFECVPIGSRVVTAVQAKDIFGDAGNPQADLAGSDTVVIVTDVVEKYTPPKPTEWTDAPDVTFDGRKSPVVTLPGGEPPADLQVQVIKKGTGAKVAAGDTVTLNYKGMNWETGKVFDESYGKGKVPISFPANQFVPGFTAAIVGQRAGARLIVSIPPKLGYGETGDNPLAGQTMVFVIEIQATKTVG